jgi:hypothetical protein
MGRGEVELKTRNYLLFRTASAYSESEGIGLTVKGYRLPFFRGRYSILVEGVHYSDVTLPKGTSQLVETVRESLDDPHDAPKRIQIRQI